MSNRSVFIRDARQLGAFVRALRKAQSLRQDEVGRLSHSFIGDIEAGKPTAQLGKLMEVFGELGVKLRLELPSGLNSARFDQYFKAEPE